MVVVLCEQTKCYSGHGVVGPTAIQSCKQGPVLLGVDNNNLYLRMMTNINTEITLPVSVPLSACTDTNLSIRSTCTVLLSNFSENPSNDPKTGCKYVAGINKYSNLLYSHWCIQFL